MGRGHVPTMQLAILPVEVYKAQQKMHVAATMGDSMCA